MSLQIRKAIIENVRVYFYPKNLSQDGDNLIDNHLKRCDKVIQFHKYGMQLADIKRVITEIKHMNKIPIFIHVYPGEDQITTVYVNEIHKTIKNKRVNL